MEPKLCSPMLSAFTLEVLVCVSGRGKKYCDVRFHSFVPGSFHFENSTHHSPVKMLVDLACSL